MYSSWGTENFLQLSPVTNPPAGFKSIKSETTNKSFEVENVGSKWNHEFTYRIKGHEPKTNKLLIEYSLKVPKKSIIIDAGAHVGDTGLLIARELKDNGRNDVMVYEIDPNREKIDFITRTAQYNHLNNVIVMQLGLSNKKEMGTENQNDSNSGAWQLNTGKGNIPLDSIDNLFFNKHKVGLMHLDVEGMELKTLQGADKVIRNYKPFIMIEYIHSNVKQLKNFILQRGYKQVWEGENNLLFTPSSSS